MVLLVNSFLQSEAVGHLLVTLYKQPKAVQILVEVLHELFQSKCAVLTSVQFKKKTTTKPNKKTLKTEKKPLSLQT